MRLETGKAAYFHDEIIDIRLWTRDPSMNARWSASPPSVDVKRSGEVLTTIAGVRSVRLAYDPETATWSGRWPCPWNAEAGDYALAFSAGGEGLQDRLKSRGFRILRRVAHPLPQGMTVLTLESALPLAGLVVTAPSGEKKDWRGLLDWVEYAGADTFWMLAGQSPGEKPGEIWTSYNLKMIPKVARECRRRGIKFGVYAMCYLTMSKARLERYQYALDVKDGRAVFTRAISLNDPNRPADVAAFLKNLAAIPEVDYLGIDYIRNALGGYELAEDFYREMPGVIPPPEWPRLSREERRVYFARKKIMRRDLAFIDAWQWWRARKVAAIVRTIKAQIGDKKPLWAFTLTWDRGWHHGQDPVMMNDAGVDADALMLYEATRGQFDQLVHDWHDYVRRGDAQLLAGDVIDWPLHQRSPDGPKEFSRRMRMAIDKVYEDGPVSGIFFHDLGRALWGRVGPWGTRGWMDEARRVADYFHSVAKPAVVPR